MMRYGSVCSGIEAASVAWHPLGWTPEFFSEIDPFCNALLDQRWPGVPNLGSLIGIDPSGRNPIDLLVGGTPCQSFSVAGLRRGMADDRGNLALEFCRLADRLQPRWVLWENVPGVLSSGRGRDFGSIVGALGEIGYGLAWRVLDAQFFGVPQRRRRVFLVGHLGGHVGRAAAVLFEPARVCRDPQAGGEARHETPAPTEAGTDSGGRRLNVSNAEGAQGLPFLTASNLSKTVNNQTPLIYSVEENQRGEVRLNPTAPPLVRGHTGKPGQNYPAVLAFHPFEDPISGPVSPALGSNHPGMGVLTNRVRRLTVRECERLQGFPDDYTLIQTGKKSAADGPRYKALGNSMATPVMRWIGERIQKVDQCAA